MPAKLTVTEAETLAVMLDFASRKMATVFTPAGHPAWHHSIMFDAAAEMFAGFYAIAPNGVYI